MNRFCSKLVSFGSVNTLKLEQTNTLAYYGVRTYEFVMFLKLRPLIYYSSFYVLAWYPNEEWVTLMQDTIMSAAPKGLDQV
jgi:hypothetical protein